MNFLELPLFQSLSDQELEDFRLSADGFLQKE